MSDQQFVIVGGGFTAAKAAETLRAEGFDGSVVILTAEDQLPYERPPLSKELLAGTGEDDAIFPHDAAWYDENNVEVRRGARATAIDRSAKTVTLRDGSTVGYDKLLLATGSAPRKLKIDGADLDGIHYLRTKANADALKADISAGGRNVVVVGGGWIGLEVAAAAQGYGNAVTVIEPQPQPLHAALGEELGAMFADLHREKGVTLRLGAGVTGFEGDNGSVTGVRIGENDVVPADVVIVGVGARPMDYLAEDAGLEVDNGIVVDASLRTSDDNIYAAGDVARWQHPSLGRKVRVEHWANAEAGGIAAAKAMLGHEVSYDHMPYFFTDQYELGMEFIGDLAGDVAAKNYDAVTYRGDAASREFIAFWTREGSVVAGMNVNVWDVVPDVEALVRSDRKVDPARLADPAVPLAEV